MSSESDTDQSAATVYRLVHGAKLRVHPLRAADALQLAAAFAAAERRPTSLELVTLDDRLADAVRKEGFVVLYSTEVEWQRPVSRPDAESLDSFPILVITRMPRAF